MITFSLVPICPHTKLSLLTIFLMLYIIFLWLVYFVIGSFYLVIYFTSFIQTLTTLPSRNHLLDIWIYKCFHLVFLLGLVFTFHIYVRSYSIYLWSKLFHLIWYAKKIWYPLDHPCCSKWQDFILYMAE